MSIRDNLEKHVNDYSLIEPFVDSKPIKSSILIPAYNEPEYLSMTLNSIDKAISDNKEFFEVIVVDDGSEEDLTTVLENANLRCDFKYHQFEENKGRSKARNKLIEMADNDLIFFFDSDVIIPKNYFSEHWKIHNATERAVAVGLAENVYEGDAKLDDIRRGIVEPSDYKKDFRYYKDIGKWAEEGQQREFKLLEQTNNFKDWNYNQPIDFWTLPYMVVSHNISVSRYNIQKVKGFDERFKGWGCEDTFLGAKLIAEGNYVIPVINNTAYRIKHEIRAGTKEERRSQMFENVNLYEQFLDEDKGCYNGSS